MTDIDTDTFYESANTCYCHVACSIPDGFSQFQYSRITHFPYNPETVIFYVSCSILNGIFQLFFH